MQKHVPMFTFIIALTMMKCGGDIDPRLAAFEVYCEMVANEAKPIALSQPMDSIAMDEYFPKFQDIAEQYEVSLYREDQFPVTSLFPLEMTEGKEVTIIYKGLSLVQYQQFVSDLNVMSELDAARRFGRLLGYTPQSVNDLLMKNIPFRTLESFRINQQVTHFYYEDLSQAREFYRDIIGLNEIAPNEFMITADTRLVLHAVDAEHPAGQPKSTAIALLSDQLPLWYEHVQEQGVTIKYTYRPKVGGPHDGFVAVDPEGYLLEFEEFKQHPENELLMASLQNATRVQTSNYPLNFHGSITWTYHNDLLKLQDFYEDVLGFTLVADQGWTKIYQTSASGFVGLVDERRGMMDYAANKAVELEWKVDEKEAAIEYLLNYSRQWLHSDQVIIGPETYRYRIR